LYKYNFLSHLLTFIRRTGELDDNTMNGTKFPLVKWTQRRNALLPISCLKEEVNIVPCDLDWFIQRAKITKLSIRASWDYWESQDSNGYSGDLALVPV
jgi:hypothetical protein